MIGTGRGQGSEPGARQTAKIDPDPVLRPAITYRSFEWPDVVRAGPAVASHRARVNNAIPHYLALSNLSSPINLERGRTPESPVPAALCAWSGGFPHRPTLRQIEGQEEMLSLADNA